jgi:hypothetical protein
MEGSGCIRNKIRNVRCHIITLLQHCDISGAKLIGQRAAVRSVEMPLATGRSVPAGNNTKGWLRPGFLAGPDMRLNPLYRNRNLVYRALEVCY